MDDRYVNLLRLLKRSEVLQGGSRQSALGPLVVCHHPQLPTTSSEEIAAARSVGRAILHVRVEQSDQGWLEVKVQKEQESYLQWGSEANAPQTLEETFRLDGDFDADLASRKIDSVPARYKYGSNLDAELGI